jgi:hypothetical protein
MNNEIKKEIDGVMIKEGDVKGEVLRDHFIYIKEKEGEEGVKKMEDLLEEYGYPLKFSEIKSLDWHKDAYCGVILLLLKEEFGWSEDDIMKMGERVTKYSFIVTRILLRYLISVDRFLKEAPGIWKKHLNFGEIKVVELNKEEKFVVLQIRGYDIHPLTCFYQRGYYTGIFKYIVKEKEVTVEETKCIYKGDNCHEYRVSWK